MLPRAIVYLFVFGLLASVHISLISSVSAQTTTPTTDVATVPDLLLDVNLSVPLIQLLIENVTAHVALDAKVLNLVSLSVGVEASIQKLNLTIKDITATAHLEARLHEVTRIVQSVMTALNNNPLLVAIASGLVNSNNIGQITSNLGNLPSVTGAAAPTVPTR